MQTIVIMKLLSQSSGLNIREQFSVGIVANLVTMLMIVGNFNQQISAIIVLGMIAQVKVQMRNIRKKRSSVLNVVLQVI